MGVNHGTEKKLALLHGSADFLTAELAAMILFDLSKNVNSTGQSLLQCHVLLFP